MTISNDGATIMKLLDVVHPAAKTLVDVSLSQDAEVRTAAVQQRIVLVGAEQLRSPHHPRRCVQQQLQQWYEQQ